ncbi:hypothetical protein [Pseudacidovorax intermedius]|uniref:hypothetical protein n=1 Tax=Pseudacidovorax intermedius TaxID=433924 RepID=UPI0003491857|nr:hypothetical protein [Pseudacidovorax intermedius]
MSDIFYFTRYEKATGRVLEVGQTMHTLEMRTAEVGVVREEAPPNTYRSGDTWVPIPPQPSPAHRFDWTAHEWVDDTPTVSVADLKTARARAVDADFSKASAALLDGYPQAERLTWPTQQAEAMAWHADAQAATPFLDGLAVHRGIPPETMRAKTLAAVQAFQQASQYLVGTRQRLQDELAQATTAEAIAAVSWPSDPP